MKRILSILLLLCIVFSLTTFVLADEDSDAPDISEPVITGSDALIPMEETVSAPAEPEEPAAEPNPLSPITEDGDGESVYTVTFETYGVCEAPAPQQVVSGGLVTKPATLPDAGLGFSRWCVCEQNNKYEWDFDYDTVTSDITLVACYWWQVDFNTSDICEAPASQLVETGDYATDPMLTAEDLELVVWYRFDEEGNKTVWNFDSDMITGDVTLEASFLIRELTGITVTDRAVVSLPALSLGHYYLARFRSEAGAADTLANMIISADKAETATTEEKLEYSIYTWSVNTTNSFNVKDGDTIYCAEGKVLNIFDCVGVEGTDKDYVTQVCTLVCPFCYIVTIEDGVNDTYGYYYFLGDVPALTVPEREGYNFDGWYYDAAYTKAYNGDAVSSSFTLYGKWSPVSTERDPMLSLRTADTVLPADRATAALAAAAVCVVAFKKREEI